MHRWVWRFLEGTCLAVAVAGTAMLVMARTGDDGSGASPATVAATAAMPTLAELFVPGTTWIDTADRDAVLTAHTAEYEPVPPTLAWSGNLGTCSEGDSNAEYREATLRRVNYYRAMAGVPAVIVEDAQLSAKAQRAALMMSAEGTLTHHPTPDFACFSRVGQEAAGNSNLYLGRTGPVAVDGYIEDPGDHNIDVGHRSTILHPPTRAMGVGDVAASDAGHAANALWVFDDHVFDELGSADRPMLREADRFVAWPPRGYVHPDLVYPRWSVTMADADFSSAEVVVYDLSASEGVTRVPLTVVNRSGAAGHVPLPTLVWEPVLEPSPDQDTSYYVVVSGVEALDDAPSAPAVGAPESLAFIERAVPNTVAYTVTVLGNEPGPDIAPELFLDQVLHRD